MITRAEAREGPKYQVSYKAQDGQLIVQKSYTKSQNDDFAKAMELMGVKDIIKNVYMGGGWYEYISNLPHEKEIKS